MSEALFSSSLPNLPIAWDTVMTGLLKDCPRKFKYIIIDGWNPPGFAAHLAFGIAFHKALELYDINIAHEMDHDAAVLEAARFCLSYGTRNPEGQFIPFDALYTKEPSKTRETLTRAVLWYLDNYSEDPLETYILKDGTPAVEYPFKIQLDLLTPDGEPFLLCGHIDRLITLNDEIYWTDRKTTKSALTSYFWSQFIGPNSQFSIYNAASQLILHKPAAGGIVDAVQIGAGFVRFGRKTLTKTPGIQAEWLENTYHWLGLASQFAAEDFWPMNETSCTKYGGCPFLSICSRDPKVREGFLKHEGFIKRQWNPLETR